MKPLPALISIFLLTALLSSVATGGLAPQAKDPDDDDENQAVAGPSGTAAVVPTAAERAAFKAFFGIREVAIVVRDASGKPLAGAHVRAFSEDWGLYRGVDAPKDRRKTCEIPWAITSYVLWLCLQRGSACFYGPLGGAFLKPRPLGVDSY
jgi:hypothetical protein